MLAILQGGVEGGLVQEQRAFPRAGRRRGGGNSGKMFATPLFCEFYPSLNQVDSRF